MRISFPHAPQDRIPIFLSCILVKLEPAAAGPGHELDEAGDLAPVQAAGAV